MPNPLKFLSPEEARRDDLKQQAVTGALAAIRATTAPPPLPAPTAAPGILPPLPGAGPAAMGGLPLAPLGAAPQGPSALAGPPPPMPSAPAPAPLTQPGTPQPGGVLPTPFAAGGTVQPSPLGNPTPPTVPQGNGPVQALRPDEMIAAMMAGMSQDGQVPPEQAHIALQTALEHNAPQAGASSPEDMGGANTPAVPAPPGFVRWLKGTQDQDNQIAQELRQASTEGAAPDELWGIVVKLKDQGADLPPSLVGMAGGSASKAGALPPVPVG